MEAEKTGAPGRPSVVGGSSRVVQPLAGPVASAIEAQGPPLLIVAPDTTIVFATQAAVRLLGRELATAKFTDFVDAADRDLVRRAAERGKPWMRVVGCPLVPSGALHCQILAPADPGSAEAGLVVVALDDKVGLRRRVAELEASHVQNLALLEAMPDLLFRISKELTFLDYRDPTTRGLGVAPEAFLGKRLDEFLPSEIAALVRPNLVEALETGKTVTYPSYYDYEDGLHTFDNRVVKSGEGEVVLICRDTTEQTRAVHALERNQARFQRIVENSREYTAITDENDIITFVSAPVESIIGFTPEELVGTSSRDLIHPKDGPSADLALARMRSHSDPRPARLRLRVKGGGWRVIEATTKWLFEDDLIGGRLTHCRDITDYVEVQDNLRDSLARLDAIVETAAEGILTIGADGMVRSLNRAARRMFRLGDGDADAITIASLFTEHSRLRITATMQRAADGGSEPLASLPTELECLRPDGSSFPVSLSMSRIEHDDEVIFAAIVRDDSESRALERQLEYQATHDVLTGLPNRNLFMANLERSLRLSVSQGHSVALLFLDLDRFKIVNDSLGHAAGDRLLCAVASRLTTAVRGDATVARFGGDEFLVLCPEIRTQAEATVIADRVLDTLRESIDIGGEIADAIFVSASVGVVIYRPELGTIEPEVMVRSADVALYRAKELGRDRYEVFDWTDSSKNLNRLSIETALRHAIARNELVVHYQPVQSLGSRTFTGTEALIRWNHDGNLIAPGRFIHIAEESDLIVDIGTWILREACRQTAEWQKLEGHRELSVAVNVSGRQLDRADFPDTVRGVLLETGLAPAALTLEITETRLVHDDSATLETLRALKRTGVSLAIDDFGTGYSSLGYLRSLPVDILKLDRCFTSQLEHDRHTHEIVRTITALAHTLGMTVVAEGVETEGQLAALLALACDHAQGFLLARPAASSAVGDMLAQQTRSIVRR